MTNVLPEHVLSAIRERRQRLAKSDCQREIPSNVLVMSQLNGSAQLLGVDLNVRAKAKLERAHKDAWEDFTAGCKRLMTVAPTSPDPREQMILFIRDMKL